MMFVIPLISSPAKNHSAIHDFGGFRMSYDPLNDVPFNAEAIAAALASAAAAGGDAASVAALAVAVPELTFVDYGEWIDD
jgi:hypothetical protein